MIMREMFGCTASSQSLVGGQPGRNCTNARSSVTLNIIFGPRLKRGCKTIMEEWLVDECWWGIGGWCECALGCGRDTVWRWGAFVIGIGRDTGCRWGAFGMGGGDADHWSDDDDDPQDLWLFEEEEEPIR